MPQTDPSHPEIESFFHKDTGTWTHVVHDGEAAAVIDPVLDYDAAAARTSTTSADAVLAFVQQRALRIEWILETHAHADHLSAAGYLHDGLDAPIAIGRGITPKDQADAYLEHLQQTALPALRDFKGQHGAWVLRRVQGEQCEFQVLTLWDSMKA